ncbi:MAG: Coenzyme F420 hydrogenase/dehydrogenase, beta subunit C-terminal domain [Deltaproteobacteria bacterium]|nr:Coenzyme F420 hydrogenase/dehydrogenase, beta subunit C-terminal domain [Deltaproteobacteria bacterium]
MATDSFNRLKIDVVDRGLCTRCGACAGLCPHFGWYQDRVAPLHDCSRQSGACEAVCPRIPCDPDALAQALAPPEIITPEMGPVRKLWVTQACDPTLRNLGQHGGTVTSLAHFALKQGVVDAWVMARSDGSLSGVPAVCRTDSQVKACSGTKLTSVPIVSGFLKAAGNGSGRFGVVATPCQCLALAKIKASNHPRLRQAAKRLALVIGLFCGWTLDLRDLRQSLPASLNLEAITGLDIPPSHYQSLEVATTEGMESVPLSEVNRAVRPACGYCFDLTAELADVSVGSARLPLGWQEARHWNQTVVRSLAGQDLVERAQTAETLILQEPPAGALEKLKAAAAGKKRTARRNLVGLSKDPDDLLYLPKGLGEGLSSLGNGA